MYPTMYPPGGTETPAQRLSITYEVGGVTVTSELVRGADDFRFACTRCETPHPRGQRRCGLCGAMFTVLLRTTIAARADERRSLENTRAIQENYLPTGVEWLDRAMGGGIPDYACWLLAGGEGAGKSTLALMALANLPTRNPPLLISTEMHSSELASYAKRLGMRSDAKVFGTEDGIGTARRVIELAREHHAGAVLVDSVGDLEDESPRATAVKRLKAWAVSHRRPVVLISQVNAQGHAEGRRKRRHDITLYTRMWKDERDPSLRHFEMAKTRHGIDGQTVTLRREKDGSLALVPPPAPAAT